MELSWRTLGIAGAGRAVGVTHLTVWMANWLASACQEAVAVLEWSGHGDFERMREFCGAEHEQGQHWRLLGVDYFSGAGIRELADCMNGFYSRILIDYGEWNEIRGMECARCDRRILVGSFSEWQAAYFADLIRTQGGKDKKQGYGVVFGSEETRISVEKEFRTAVQRIPFSADAFSVTGNDMRFFRTWDVLV